MKSDFLADYDLEADIEKQFPKIWASLLIANEITPQEKPICILLGGQPGAGKSFGSEEMSRELNGNVVIINGDEFRSYHHFFEEICSQDNVDLAHQTQRFANAMVNRVKNEAFKQRFNVIIEGTFRTTEVPLKELCSLKNQGYQTGVIICTCPKEVSWESTIKRGNEQKAKGLPPRYVDKTIHDYVVEHLAENVVQVFEQGKPDFLRVYSRTQLLFNSKSHRVEQLANAINEELNNVSGQN